MILQPLMSETRPDAVLRGKAAELEATFIAEMLSHTGLDQQSTNFSGGHGEEQFTSFLRQEHAKAIGAAGGLGLAEHLFQALAGRTKNAG